MVESPHPAPPNSSSLEGGTHEVLLVGALFMAMLISTLPEFALGVLGPVLVDDLPIGEAGIGVAASSMYLGAAIVARTGGRVLDDMERRLSLVVLYGAAALSLLLLASSRSLGWLLAVGIVGSVGLGINNPITSRLIVEGVREGRRGLAIGIKQTGVKVGQSLAGAVLPALALAIGWRAGLGAAAALSAVLLALSLLVVPNAKRTAPTTQTDGSVASARRQVRWLQVYSFMMAISQSALTIYLALYAAQRLGASTARSGLLITAFAVTATATRLVWVAAAERAMAPRRALLTLSAGAGAAMVALVVAPTFGGMGMLWFAAILSGTTIGAWNVVVQLAIVTEVPGGRAASATGAVQAAFMLGLATGAPAFGVLIEATGSFAGGWSGAAGLCALAWATAWQHGRHRVPRE